MHTKTDNLPNMVAQVRRIGRPRLSEKGTRTVPVRLTEELYQEVQEFGQDDPNFESEAQKLRRLIRDGLEFNRRR